jgi:hypothetical protein
MIGDREKSIGEREKCHSGRHKPPPRAKGEAGWHEEKFQVRKEAASLQRRISFTAGSCALETQSPCEAGLTAKG